MCAVRDMGAQAEGLDSDSLGQADQAALQLVGDRQGTGAIRGCGGCYAQHLGWNGQQVVQG